MKVLLDECIDWRLSRDLADHQVMTAREMRWTSLRLETGLRQTVALRLYQRAGFQVRAAFGAYATMAPQALATSAFLQKQLGTAAER
jgi:hypothetical protein